MDKSRVRILSINLVLALVVVGVGWWGWSAGNAASGAKAWRGKMRWRINVEVTRPGWSAPMVFTLEGPEMGKGGLTMRLVAIRKMRTEQ